MNITKKSAQAGMPHGRVGAQATLHQLLGSERPCVAVVDNGPVVHVGLAAFGQPTPQLGGPPRVYRHCRRKATGRKSEFGGKLFDV